MLVGTQFCAGQNMASLEFLICPTWPRMDGAVYVVALIPVCLQGGVDEEGFAESGLGQSGI